MHPAEVIVSEVKREGCAVIGPSFAESVCQSRKPSGLTFENIVSRSKVIPILPRTLLSLINSVRLEKVTESGIFTPLPFTGIVNLNCPIPMLPFFAVVGVVPVVVMSENKCWYFPDIVKTKGSGLGDITERNIELARHLEIARHFDHSRGLSIECRERNIRREVCLAPKRAELSNHVEV